MMPRQVLYLFLFICFIAACSDAEIKPNPTPEQSSAKKLSPKKITPKVPLVLHQLEADGTTFYFKYNNRDQLISLSLSRKSETGKKRDSSFAKLIYKDDRPVAVETKWMMHGQTLTDHTSLQYDESGRVVRSTLDLENIVLNFKYNKEGKLTGVSNEEYTDEWDYNADGNVIRHDYVKPYPSDDPKSDNHYKGTFTYDDNTNPFSCNSLGVLLYTMGVFSQKHYTFLSQNNPLTIVDDMTHVSRKPLPNYKSSGTRTTTSFTNNYDKDKLLTTTVEESTVQAFTNEEPDLYNKDRITTKPVVKYICSVKKNTP